MKLQSLKNISKAHKSKWKPNIKQQGTKELLLLHIKLIESDYI